MAEAAISFAAEKLSALLIQKLGFGVEGQVKWLKSELERMQSFLKDASEKQAHDERIRKWISDIREVAQDADDASETFILRIDNARRSRRGLLRRWGYFPIHVYHLNRVREEIESIRARLEDIDKSRERYGIQNLDDGIMMMSSRRSGEVEWRRRLSPWQKDKHVVGLEEDVELLLQRAILEEREGLSIASIVGMGGIGKSTLARILYNHAAVADRFDRRAWVVVSREFNPKEIIKELILQLLDPTEDKLKVLETMEKLQVQSLQHMLHQRLQGARYFVVLDDVWEETHWESLACAFPDQDKASRLLLTSRTRNIPKYAQYVHEMKILDPNESWQLFLKKAFISGKCPQDLENIGQEILKKCNGLPLAIIVVGGLLVKQRQYRIEWEKVLKGLNSQLGRSKNSVSAVLELSYHNLHPQLKSCFLCLGFFKEDATICAKKLVQVWVAEGLVICEGVGGEEKVTIEEIGASYLDELINRNMIQIKDTSKDDQVKKCHVHDLLRDLSIAKANEEICFEILRKGNSQSSNKPRHRAIYHSRERLIYSTDSNEHLRSLFFHGAGNIDSSPSYWKSFKLLRVLDFEDFGLEVLPYTVGALSGLRYLGLRNNNLRELPNSLGHLKNLEVFDITLNLMVEVPNVLWKMVSLRHLYMSRIRCKVPLRIDNLKNLQTLTYIPVANWVTEQPIQMRSLRKLGIDLDENSDVIKLCTSLSILENLVWLHLKWKGLQSMSFLDGLGCLNRLTRLKLQGRLSKLPSVSNLPPNLSHLSLDYTVLDEDPIPILEKLPNLLYLKLDYAYTGEKITISDNGFPKLQVLCLQELFRLRNIAIGRGGMLKLKRLEIYKCPYLDNLPEELKLMTNLQELKMLTTTETASKLQGVNLHIISNIPSVNIAVVPFRYLLYMS